MPPKPYAYNFNFNLNEYYFVNQAEMCCSLSQINVFIGKPPKAKLIGNYKPLGLVTSVDQIDSDSNDIEYQSG